MPSVYKLNCTEDTHHQAWFDKEKASNNNQVNMTHKLPQRAHRIMHQFNRIIIVPFRWSGHGHGAFIRFAQSQFSLWSSHCVYSTNKMMSELFGNMSQQCGWKQTYHQKSIAISATFRNMKCMPSIRPRYWNFILRCIRFTVVLFTSLVFFFLSVWFRSISGWPICFVKVMCDVANKIICNNWVLVRWVSMGGFHCRSWYAIPMTLNTWKLFCLFDLKMCGMQIYASAHVWPSGCVHVPVCMHFRLCLKVNFNFWLTDLQWKRINFTACFILPYIYLEHCFKKMFDPTLSRFAVARHFTVSHLG